MGTSGGDRIREREGRGGLGSYRGRRTEGGMVSLWGKCLELGKEGRLTLLSIIEASRRGWGLGSPRILQREIAYS